MGSAANVKDAYFIPLRAIIPRDRRQRFTVGTNNRYAGE